MKKYTKMLAAAVMVFILAVPARTSLNVFADAEEPVPASGMKAEEVQHTSDEALPEEKTLDTETLVTEETSNDPVDESNEETDASDDQTDDSEYSEWQTEEDEYDTESIDTIHFIIVGADSVNAAFNSDFNVPDSEVRYDEEIRNGDQRELLHGSTVRIKGIKGCYIRAAYGETQEEARKNPDPEVSGEGKSVSVGQDGSGYIYILVSENRESLIDDNTAVATVADDEEGSIIYSDISNEEADAGKSQNSFPKVGQKFTGTASLKSYKLKTHNSIGYLVPQNGWLKENTTQKNIAAVCISGPTKAMANKGAKFNYVVRILEADPAAGKIRIGITFKPRSNKNNVSWGTVNNYHAGTQVLYKSMYVQLHALTGYVSLRKVQTPGEHDFSSEFPGNYSLEGAVYKAYTDKSCTSPAKDTDGTPMVFITSADGSSKVYETEPGTYYIKETKPSRGHMTDKSIHTAVVTTQNDASSPVIITSKETPVYSELNLSLVKENEEYGFSRLIGTKYELSYYDTDPDDPVISDATLKSRCIYSASAKTTEQGLKTAGIDFSSDSITEGEPLTVNGKRIIPLGVIMIREIEAPKGLAVDKTVYMGTVRQSGDSAKVSINGQKSLTVHYDNNLLHEEDTKKIKLILQKVDAETGMPYAEGAERQYSAGSLEGAVYEVRREDADLEKDVKAGEIITDEKGYGELTTDESTGKELMPGRYYLRELKPSAGYVNDCLSEEEVHNKYEDGDHIVIARADLDSNIYVYEYQTVSHEMHHETYISKTDITTGAELPGARLRVINSDGNTVDEWTSGTEPHLIKALPDGVYTLREITSPYGYDIAEDIRFEVSSSIITNKVEMKNRPLTIGTTASDSQTGTHYGTLSSEEVIVDKVKLTGLYPGRKYKVSGTVVEKGSGIPLYRKVTEAEEGYGSGIEEELIPVAAEKEFTADAENMEIELSFTVDSSDFENGAAVVVFEKLYRVSAVAGAGEDEELPKELQKHENPDDEGQTILYGTEEEKPAPDKPSSPGPKTGDESRLMLFVSLALMSSAALSGIIIYRKRRC